MRRILYAKFPDFTEDCEALLAAMVPHIAIVRLGLLFVDVCRDPDDNRMIETAVIGQAEYIVPGDKDLLALEKPKSIKNMPARFLST